MSDRCSQGSEEWTTDSPQQGSGTSSSASPTSGDEPSSPTTGPESPFTTTYETWQWRTREHTGSFEQVELPNLTRVAIGGTGGAKLWVLAVSENQRGEIVLSEQAHQLTCGGGKPGQGYPAIFTSSAEGSPARTSVSPANAEDSTETDPDSSSSSPESLNLFDPDGFSSRTYQGSSPRTMVGTSESCLERWPTSGTAWATGFSTHVSSECRSDEDGCSSSEPSLSQILEEPQNVPARYSLSARAAQGILRRAPKRGKTLPEHLAAALEAVAGHRTPKE